ncbi:MAG: FAD-dependent oxidoreductase, partial [Proteobacteria bacterium]|nr:FAD-dependent oxidoreductase [Pseudomonadota bacterium]
MSFFKRDIAEFERREFDLLVIGGGINGLGIAWDAALRGLKVAVVEKDDFGGLTSAACFNIIHGGVRYLQHLDVKRLRKSVKEQRILRQIAGKIVKPLPVTVPCYGEFKKSKTFLRLGMLAYETLAVDRNKKVIGDLKLNRHQTLTQKELLNFAEGLDTQGLKAGVVFYDCQMSSSERFTLQVAKAAKRAGAAVANYLEFQSTEGSQNNNTTVVLVDKISQKEIRLKTKVIVNATGPHFQAVSDKILASKTLHKQNKKDYVKGIQFVFKKDIGNFSIAVESRFKDKASKINRGGRSFFLVPWHNHTLVGTYEIPVTSTQQFSISEEEINSFLKDFKHIYQDDSFNRENLITAWGGFIPLEKNSNQVHYKVARDDEIIDETSTPQLFHQLGFHFISVVGVKYTTFRSLSEEVVNLVFKKLKKKAPPSLTAMTRIDSDLDNFQEVTNYAE